MGCEKLIKVFFNILLNIKLYHWETTSYARHKASCELHTNLSEQIDKFIEVYIGRYKRPQFDDSFDINVEQLHDDNVKHILENYKSILKHELPKYLKSSDTDLLNIRDDMLAEFNKTLYLFTLN